MVRIEPGQLRAAYEAARDRARAQAAEQATDPVRRRRPGRPSLRELVAQDRARRRADAERGETPS